MYGCNVEWVMFLNSSDGYVCTCVEEPNSAKRFCIMVGPGLVK
jgi:hypothetical protein